MNIGQTLCVKSTHENRVANNLYLSDKQYLDLTIQRPSNINDYKAS